MSSVAEQVSDQFELIRRQRDAALRDLNQAQELNHILQAEIKTLRYHGDLAMGRLGNELALSKQQLDRPLEVKVDAPAEWIGNWWLCTEDTTSVLFAAESAWREDQSNPQSAINLASTALKTNLKMKERLRCRLFIAAVQLSVAQLVEACAIVNECIKDCGTDPRYRELFAVACYLRGRILTEMNVLYHAHWDFSIALLSSDYHEEAKLWQSRCEACILAYENGEMTPVDSFQETTEPGPEGDE